MDIGLVDPILAEIGDAIVAVSYIGIAVLTVAVVIKVHRWARQAV